MTEVIYWRRPRPSECAEGTTAHKPPRAAPEMAAGAFLPERRGCVWAGKPMGLTLPDSPPPATPSAGRHGGQHTALSPVSA
jgi:hypothetical protein